MMTDLAVVKPTLIIPARMVATTSPTIAAFPSTPMHDITQQRETLCTSEISQPKGKAGTLNTKHFTTQIIDLNIDCLEQIFKFVDVIDLLNISDLCEEAMIAATMVYSMYYSNRLLKISGMNSSSSMQQSKTTISVCSSDLCTTFLNTFGFYVKKMELSYLMDLYSYDDWTTVKDLIYEKCAKNLIELNLVNCEEDIFDGISEPLINIKKLRISCSRLGKCIELDKWFPNLERLELIHNGGCVQIFSSFPFLSYLAMNMMENACLNEDDLETMLKSAPKLQMLSLNGGIDIGLLKFINDNLANLKHLRLHEFHLKDDYNEPIYFKGIETIHITNDFCGNLPPEMLFTFDDLKELRLKCDTLNNEWIKFAMKNKNLEKLELLSLWESNITVRDLIKYVDELEKLTELKITVSSGTSEDITHLLNQSGLLKKISIKLYNQSGNNKWNVLSCGNNWIMKKQSGWYTFVRNTK